MAAYNEEAFIENSIKSVLNQTFKDFEFIIVNDGSSDTTGEIIEKYRLADDRIIHIQNKKNIGFQKSLNKGIIAAKGKFIARQDADDASHPKRFEIQLEILNRKVNIDLLATRSMHSLDNTLFEFYDIGTYSQESIVLSKPKLARGCDIVHGSVMIKTAILKKYLYNENILFGEDYDLWLRLEKAQYNLRIVELKLYKYKSRLNHPRAFEFYLASLRLKNRKVIYNLLKIKYLITIFKMAYSYSDRFAVKSRLSSVRTKKLAYKFFSYLLFPIKLL